MFLRLLLLCKSLSPDVHVKIRSSHLIRFPSRGVTDWIPNWLINFYTEIISFFFLLDICVYANKNKWDFLDAFNLLSFEFATISHKSTFTSSFCEQSPPHLITFRNIWFLQYICSVEKGSECSLCKSYKKSHLSSNALAFSFFLNWQTRVEMKF